MKTTAIHALRVLSAAAFLITGVLPSVSAEGVHHREMSMAPSNQIPRGDQTVGTDPRPEAWSSIGHTAGRDSQARSPRQAEGSQAVDPGPWEQDYPSATSDSAGNAYVVWEDSREGSTHIRFAERARGGDWQPSVRIDPATSSHQWSPEIAIDGHGNLHALWVDDRGDEPQIYAAYRSAQGDWEASQPISTTSEVQSEPALAVNRRGEALAGWRQGAWPEQHVFCAFRPLGGGWEAGEQVSDEGDPRAIPDVALDDWGRAYVAWNTWDPGEILFRIRSSEGIWGQNEQIRDTLIAGPSHASGVQIALDGSRNVHAVWEDRRNGESEIYAGYRPVVGSWSVNTRIDNGNGSMWSPGIALDGAGNAVAAWSEENTDVYGAVRYLGSGWTPSDLLASQPGSAGETDSELRPASPRGPQATASWFAAVTALGPMADLLFVGPSMLGDTNILATDLVPPGGTSGNPCANVSATAAIANRVLWPQARTQVSGDPCRAGNGSQEPAANPDLSSQQPYGPPEAPPSGYVILERVIDGQTVYVVDAMGGDGVFSDLGDAEQFAQEHATPPVDMADFTPTADDFLPGAAAGQPDEAQQHQQQISEVAQLLEQLHGGGGESWFTAEAFVESLQSWNLSAEELAEIERQTHEDLQQREESGSSPEPLPPEELLPPEGLMQPEPPAPPQPEPGAAPKPTPRDPNAPIRSIPTSSTPATESEFTIMTRIGEVDVLGYLPKGTGTTPGGGSYAFDPVLAHSGEFIHQQTLLRIPGRGLDYEFRLTYHSQLIYDGPLGWGWEHSYDRRIVSTGAGSLALKEGSGRFDVYSFDGASFTSPAGRFTTLVSTTTGITINDRHGTVESYYPLDGSASEGHLRAIADRNSNTLLFDYDGQGRLQTVTDTLGRAISYAYDGNGRITSVSDFAGRAVTLDYDANGDLVSITTPPVTGSSNGNDFPLGETTIFSYSAGYVDPRLNHNLIAIISPNEVADGSLTPRTINTYGADGVAFDRVTHQSWGGGRANASGVPAGGDVTVVYTTTIELDAPPGAASKTTITNRGGNEMELWHDGAGHRLRQRQIVGSQALVTDYAYNGDGKLAGVTYPEGNQVTYDYDDEAPDRLAQGNLLEMRRVPDASRGCDGAGSGPCLDLVTSYTYTSPYNLLRSITDLNANTRTNTYDANGNLIRVDFPEVTVGPSAPQSAFQTWTHNTHGQPLTFTDPEGNKTCYAYYDSGSAEGYRQAVTRDCDGADITTEYGYDAVGNVTVITDARGIRTDYEVNALNQVIKETRATAIPDSASYALRFTHYDDVNRKDVMRNSTTLPALDYETVYWYDANDNLVRVDVENVQPVLDADFHPTGVHSRDAINPWFTTSYDYDLLDNVVTTTVEISSTAQAVTGRRYDALENLISLTDPAGNCNVYAYDERSLAITTTRGAGTPVAATTTSAYDANGNLVRVTDGEGHATDHVIDGFDRRVGQVDALGNFEVWTLDGNDNVLQTLFRDGQDGRNPDRTITATAPVTLSHTVNQFDERNRRYAHRRATFAADVDTGIITPITTDGDGDRWAEATVAYDRNGNRVASTDDNSSTTSYAYDALDRLVVITDALSNTVAHVYDPNDNLIQTVSSERQPDGSTPPEVFTVTSSYDAANRMTAQQDNLGHTTRYAYDSRGNRVFISDANGPVSAGDSTRRGDFSRSTAEAVTTQPSNNHGNTAVFAYNGLGRRILETYHLRAGGTGSGAVTSEATTAYTYDPNGNVIARSDPTGSVTSYGYDALNRTTYITYADGTNEVMRYDRASNLVERTDANGSVTTHTYDDLNRRTRTDVVRADGVGGTTIRTFTYDGLSRLTGSTDNNDPADPIDDSIVNFDYNSLSNRLRETQDGWSVSHTYDATGNPLTLRYPSGEVLTYTYDALNRVSSIVDTSGALASCDYVGPRRVLTRTHRNGTYTVYAYDAVRRMSRVSHRRSSDAAPLSDFTYSYDRVGNRLSETAQPGGTTTYIYDSLYRLTGVQGPHGNRTYAYDLAGNRTTATEDGIPVFYATNVVHGYDAGGGEIRTHDANGNLRSRSFSTAPSETSFIYLPLVLRGAAGAGLGPVEFQADHVPHKPVIGQTYRTAPSATVGGTEEVTDTLITYAYDVSNRLIGVTTQVTVTDAQATDRFTETVRYSYDGLGRRTTGDGDNGFIRYLYTDRRVVEERDQTDALLATYAAGLMTNRGGSVSFYQADGTGSVRALANHAGTVTERVDYDPFGTPVFEGSGNESAFDNPYLFRSIRYDADVELYVYGGRRHDPATARYLQRGPESFGNPYTFAGNNPLRR